MTLKHQYFSSCIYSFTIRDMYWHLSRWKIFQSKSKIAPVIDPSIKRSTFVGHTRTWKSELGAFINYIPHFERTFVFPSVSFYFMFSTSLMSKVSHQSIRYSRTWNSVFSILWAEMAKSGTNENFLKFAQISYF